MGVLRTIEGATDAVIKLAAMIGGYTEERRTNDSDIQILRYPFGRVDVIARYSSVPGVMGGVEYLCFRVDRRDHIIPYSIEAEGYTQDGTALDPYDEPITSDQALQILSKLGFSSSR